MTLGYLAMHSRPETRKKIGLIRSNWLIYRIFPSKKSKVTTSLGALEQKVHNPPTQTRCQFYQETKPIKVKYINPPKTTLKRYFHLFTYKFFGVSMFDFYWFGVQVILAPFLGSWVVYFLLQGPQNSSNLGSFGKKCFTN